MADSKTSNTKALALWLFACCALVFAMIVVGAITRLTDSGLSMVEWRPLMGAIPPLSDTEWARVFALYQQSPEFQKQNSWMTLGDFKSIFFWEWAHRALGRLIGLAYALPFLWFLIRKQIPGGYKLKLFGIFLLGGAQGFMGWYMVQSGLVDLPDVSHYRLAAHLALALLILGLMFWLGLAFIQKGAAHHPSPHPSPALYTHGWIALGFVSLTIFWGAYTAGLDAGLIYNETFPKMGEHWLPPNLWQRRPLWINFFENHEGVQFAHRWLAIFTALVVLSLCARAIKQKTKRTVFYFLAVMVVVQVALGISTLLSGISLPLAVLHQAGAVTLLLVLLACLRNVRPRKE